MKITTQKSQLADIWQTLAMIAVLMAVACTKDGDTIYQADPNEPVASTAPLVTVVYGTPETAFFSLDDSYGETFFNWAPFHAGNIDVTLSENQQYQTTDQLTQYLSAYYDHLKKNKASYATSTFCG